jgi:ribokinase
VRFVAVGDVMVDVVCDHRPEPGERVHGRAVLRAGGSAVNAALVAAELGADAQVVGRVGSDAAGDLVVATLAARGVTAHLARDVDLPTGVAVALEDAVVADRGANSRLASGDVPAPLPGDALLVSGFVLFQEGSRDGARAALERFEGEWAAVDLSSPKLAAEADLSVPANVVFATEEEARAVTGLEPDAASRALAGHFDVVCIKLEDGALARRRDQVADAAVNRVERTSPFGAGDAFAAAFLIALAGGADLDDVLRTACKAGARAVASP